MINREMRPVTVVTYTSGTDSYGVPRTVESSTRTIDMITKIYNQTHSSSPLYNEVEVIGLTKDFGVSDSNKIKFDDETYNIIKVLPARKYLEVLMKREN